MALTTIEYTVANRQFRSQLAKPHHKNVDTLGILVFPDWSGCNPFAQQTAEKLADLGYVALAVDVYGDGKTAQEKSKKTALIQPLLQNRADLRDRVQAAYQALHNQGVNKIAAIGFCFGGLCALDLMRSGADLKGVVGFHSLLMPPEHLKNAENLKAQVLILHGYDDPMVPPEQVNDFINEMNTAKIDWQIHQYSHTQHAFMNPEAHDVDSGIVYQPKTAQRAWQLMQQFLQDL